MTIFSGLRNIFYVSLICDTYQQSMWYRTGQMDFLTRSVLILEQLRIIPRNPEETWKIIMVLLVLSKYLLTALSFMYPQVGVGVVVIPHNPGEGRKEL